ncbi:hypothetical protein MUTS15_21490 [Escherichia coli]|nr:hypothetical protein MUTS15_21490 [Escherichia coli]
MFEALDALKENDVYITTGSSLRYALWGGLMSTRAMHLKAAGAVLDGYARDSAEILELKFPTFVMALTHRIKVRAARSSTSAYLLNFTACE